MSKSAGHKHTRGHSAKQHQKRFLKHKGKRDLDLIQVSVKTNVPIENLEEMPAQGKFSCKICDVYLRDEKTLDAHYKTKAHKKRNKEFNQNCHNTKQAEAAAGLFSEKDAGYFAGNF